MARPTARPRPARWLTVDLLLRLMAPLIVIVLATAAFGTFTAQRQVARVYDRWLLDGARSVAAQIRLEQGKASLDLPRVAESILLFDENDHIYFSVSQGDALLAGKAGIPLAGANEAAIGDGALYDASFEGGPVRVARVRIVTGGVPTVTVLVAETGLKRERSAEELLAVLWPMLTLTAAAGLTIWIAVRRAVQPLSAIAARWNERSHASLQAIADDGVPRELLPFTAALNDLLARIRGLLARERQFAATAAHQLRTPLAGLQLGLSRAAASNDLAQAQAILRELGQTTERTARVVQQLLTLGSIDRENRGDMAFEPRDLVALAEEIGAMFGDAALARRVDLELSSRERPVIAPVVPDLIAEAIANLIDNALRYTPEGGRILVEVEARPAAIRVSDSGPGIPEEERELVFQRFVRGRAASGDGSGLGLAIVSEIAMLHGASVELGDSAWGGAAVTITLAASTASPAGGRGPG